ncbi:MAG: hypothetical protein ABI388_05005 [Bacteroidia bacterium]
MKKHKIIKITTISLSVIAILFIVLIVHIALVMKPKNVENNIQLSRIDFKQKVDSTEGVKIVSFVRSLEGVENAYFNPKSGILICGFYNQKQNSQNVYDRLMAYGHYKAERFVINASNEIKGCPAMGADKSFVYTLASNLADYLTKNKYK